MRKTILVTLSLLVSVVVSAASVSFKNIWLEHNATQDGDTGMKVFISFEIYGMKDQDCKAIAYFDYPQGTGIKDTNGRYCTTAGTVCASTEFSPGYETTAYPDLCIFIPYSELHLLPGKRTYYTRVFIQAPNGNFLGNSEFAAFDGTGSGDEDVNNGFVETFRINIVPGNEDWGEWEDDRVYDVIFTVTDKPYDDYLKWKPGKMKLVVEVLSHDEQIPQYINAFVDFRINPTLRSDTGQISSSIIFFTLEEPAKFFCIEIDKDKKYYDTEMYEDVMNSLKLIIREDHPQFNELMNFIANNMVKLF